MLRVTGLTTARGAAGANAKVEVAKRRIAERMAMMLFMVAMLLNTGIDSRKL